MSSRSRGAEPLRSAGGNPGELFVSALAADAAAAQENEAIADTGRISDLVNRQEQGPPLSGMSAEGYTDLAALAEVESVEGLVGEEDRVRCQQPDGKHGTFPLTLGERPDRRIEDRPQRQPIDHFLPAVSASAEIAEREIQCPGHRLRRPRCNRVGKVEDRRGPPADVERLPADAHGS